MSSCDVCNKVNGQVLTLPCSNQCQACRQCLQALGIEPGTAVKCPKCRQPFGKSNFELWKVKSGTDPVQQICSFCLEKGETSLSVQFCIDCEQQLCENCFKYHQRLHRDGKAHKTIPYDEYRVSSNKFTKWQCGVRDLPVGETCSECGQVGRLQCQIELVDFQSGDENAIVPPHIKSEQASSVVSCQCDAKQASGIAAGDKLNGLLQSMENYRVKINDGRSKLQAQLDSTIEQLKIEHSHLDEELENRLHEKAEQVEAERDCLLKKINSPQSLQDGMGAVLPSYHPFRPKEIEDSNKRQVEMETTVQETINFTAPQLVHTATNQASLFGMSLSVPTREVIKEPSSLTHIRTILPPVGRKTETVSHSSIGADSIVHGGNRYVSLPGLNVERRDIDCIRFDDGGNLVMLERDTFDSDSDDGEDHVRDDERDVEKADDDQEQSVIVAYERKISPDGQICYIKSHITPCPNEYGGHFIQADEKTFYQTALESIPVFIHKKGLQRTRQLRHVEMRSPEVICRHQNQLYVACRNAIMTFSHTDPFNTLRKFSSTDAHLSSISYHRGYLYAGSYSSGWQIFIFNMEGKKVRTLNIPEAEDVSDISIDEDGCVAVAASKQGVVLYQLNYKE